MGSASKAKQYVNRTLLVALVIVVIGLLGFAAHLLFAKMTACPPGGNVVWYCNVKGKSYIVVIVLVSLTLSVIGFATYAMQKRR
jgi:preprotein translocase subunit Sss1